MSCPAAKGLQKRQGVDIGTPHLAPVRGLVVAGPVLVASYVAEEAYG